MVEEKFEEQPTLDEGATPTENVIETDSHEETSQEEVAALLADLKKAGVTNPQQLQGKLRASEEAGNLARMLGDNRKELEDVKELLAAQGARPVNDDDYSGGESIDLKQAIKAGIKEDREEQSKQVQQMQQQQAAQWNYIQQDKDYELVKEVWEMKLQDPGFVYKIQSQQINPVMEYMETVRENYKTMNIKSAEAIEQLMGKGNVPIPHIEGAARTPAMKKEETDETKQKIDSYRERVDRGETLTEEEQMDALMGVLKR